MAQKIYATFLLAILLAVMLCSCKSVEPSKAITDTALYDIKTISDTVKRIETQTSDNCKTQALLTNLESLKALAISIGSQVENVEKACSTEKEVLRVNVLLWKVICGALGILIACLTYILIRRWK